MWAEITEEDVLSALNEAELTAYKVAVIRVGQEVLPQIIKQVTNSCRGRIADCSRNKLAEGMTLPERVHFDAMALIRFRMMTRLDLTVSDDRRKEQKDAITFFKEVAKCEVSLEQPEGADTDSQSAPSPGIRARRRRFTRHQQDGI